MDKKCIINYQNTTLGAVLWHFKKEYTGHHIFNTNIIKNSNKIVNTGMYVITG